MMTAQHESIALCALGEHVLQDALYRALGARWLPGESAARAAASVPHPLLYGAVTLTPAASAQNLRDVDGRICDSFAAFEAAELPDHEPTQGHAWMLRPPGPLPSAAGGDAPVVIRRVETAADLDTWEDVSFRANGERRGRSGEIHPPSSLVDARLRFFLAEQDARAIGTALGVIGDHTVTVSAVTVMPQHRGRGLGALLTRAVIDAAPDLTAVLSASALGESVYRRLGFQTAGRPIDWRRRSWTPSSLVR